MSKVPDAVRCMVIPLHEHRLVLPNAAVAEIIGYRDPDPLDEAGPGIEGMVTWRQRELPVIDFERLMGAADHPPGIRQRIAVCYAQEAEVGWPLVGLISQGIPRLLRLAREAVEEASSGPHGDSAIQMRIHIGGEQLIVPDLVHLQGCLAAAGSPPIPKISPQRLDR